MSIETLTMLYEKFLPGSALLLLAVIVVITRRILLRLERRQEQSLEGRLAPAACPQRPAGKPVLAYRRPGVR